jgi:anti-anti-sigma factor
MRPLAVRRAARGYVGRVNDPERAVDLARHVARRQRQRMAGPSGGESFRLAIDGRRPVPRVVLGGDLDIAALPRLRSALRSLLGAEPAEIEVDLAGVELMETAAAAFLTREQAAAGARGTRLRLTGARNIPAMLLGLAGGDRY